MNSGQSIQPSAFVPSANTSSNQLVSQQKQSNGVNNLVKHYANRLEKSKLEV